MAADKKTNLQPYWARIPKYLRTILISVTLKQEKRSLDLDATRGGAGAPVRDYHGKPITRFPTTMIRDDTGGNRKVISEDRK